MSLHSFMRSTFGPGWIRNVRLRLAILLWIFASSIGCRDDGGRHADRPSSGGWAATSAHERGLFAVEVFCALSFVVRLVVSGWEVRVVSLCVSSACLLLSASANAITDEKTDKSTP